MARSRAVKHQFRKHSSPQPWRLTLQAGPPKNRSWLKHQLASQREQDRLSSHGTVTFLCILHLQYQVVCFTCNASHANSLARLLSAGPKSPVASLASLAFGPSVRPLSHSVVCGGARKDAGPAVACYFGTFAEARVSVHEAAVRPR